VVDPLERWRALGLPDKPDYAGLLTYAGMPYTQDPGELRGVDVAIVGAPLDDLVSDRPGARFAPRAIRAASCPPGPHLEAKVDALAELTVVDFGDAPVVPAAPQASRGAIEATVRQVVDAGAIPVVLGGDHSIAEPNMRACAAGHGPLGLVHFDTPHGHGDRGLRRRTVARHADVGARRGVSPWTWTSWTRPSRRERARPSRAG
jgi:arginase family enzyme